MAQYCYLRLHFSPETVSYCLMQRWKLGQVYARHYIHVKDITQVPFQ